jgi:hypothetical protein
LDRLIVPAPGRVRALPGDPDTSPNGDKALGRLLKYIPAEVISGYMTLGGLLQAANSSSPLYPVASWSLLVLGTIVTPLYLWRVGNPKGIQWVHLPISTISFVLWAYALGGPFESVQFVHGIKYERWFATFVAGAFTWVIALVWKPSTP